MSQIMQLTISNACTAFQFWLKSQVLVHIMLEIWSHYGGVAAVFWQPYSNEMSSDEMGHHFLLHSEVLVTQCSTQIHQDVKLEDHVIRLLCK